LASRRNRNSQHFSCSTSRGAAPEKAARCFQAEGEENSFAWLTAAAALGAAAGDHGQMAGNADCEGRTLNSSLFRSRLLCIIRWETTIRASIAEFRSQNIQAIRCECDNQVGKALLGWLVDCSLHWHEVPQARFVQRKILLALVDRSSTLLQKYSMLHFSF
jgi:hypothetical protein